MRTGILRRQRRAGLGLTSVAVAAPPTNALDGRRLDRRARPVRGRLRHPTNPQSRITGNSFGPAFVVQGEVSVDDEAIVLAAPSPYYLRTVTYDHYTGRGWDSTQAVRRQVAPSAFLFEELDERATDDPRESSRSTASRSRWSRRSGATSTAGSPITVYAPSVVHEPNGEPLLGGDRARQPAQPGRVGRARRRDLDRHGGSAGLGWR